MKVFHSRVFALLAVIVDGRGLDAERAGSCRQGTWRGGAVPPPPPQAGHPSGNWSSGVTWRTSTGRPIPTLHLTNRFKRGQRVGFRMTAIDGGTGEVENTATLVAHVNYMGKVIDAPMRFRGAGAQRLRRHAATAPDDGALDRVLARPRRRADRHAQLYGTATDKFGRTETFTPSRTNSRSSASSRSERNPGSEMAPV